MMMWWEKPLELPAVGSQVLCFNSETPSVLEELVTGLLARMPVAAALIYGQWPLHYGVFPYWRCPDS
jgi:hypothetical protein